MTLVKMRVLVSYLHLSSFHLKLLFQIKFPNFNEQSTLMYFTPLGIDLFCLLKENFYKILHNY